MIRPSVVLGATLSLFFLTCGGASAARSYPDRVGDVANGAGPDLVSLKVSNTKTAVTFVVRFAKAPPLRVNADEGWIDMLLLGVDVPPLGPRPTVPGGDWLGADYAFGAHGPSKSGLMVRLTKAPASARPAGRFPIVTRASTLTFSIARRSLGNPAWFTFSVAAARETANQGRGGGMDFIPNRGTLRYALTR